jgi:hypothetical protein
MIGLQALRYSTGDRSRANAVAPYPAASASQAPWARTAPRFAGVLPRIAPGQFWIAEAPFAGGKLQPFEQAAFAAANVIAYDRELTAMVAGLLPLGGYAEPVATAVAARARQHDRLVRLALDGWSVFRLVRGAAGAAERGTGLRQAAELLRAAGIGAELPVQLVVGAAERLDIVAVPIGDLAAGCDGIDFAQRITAVCVTRQCTRLRPLLAISDNGVAG